MKLRTARGLAENTYRCPYRILLYMSRRETINSFHGSETSLDHVAIEINHVVFLGGSICRGQFPLIGENDLDHRKAGLSHDKTNVPALMNGKGNRSGILILLGNFVGLEELGELIQYALNDVEGVLGELMIGHGSPFTSGEDRR